MNFDDNQFLPPIVTLLLALILPRILPFAVSSPRRGRKRSAARGNRRFKVRKSL